MYYVSRIASLLALAALSVACWFSIRLAQADADFRRRDPRNVVRAAAIMPRNTEYLSFRALQLAYDGEDPAPLLLRIVSLTPLASAPRIRLGLAAEIRGDAASAEKWLLEAAAVDRQFEPRWTLANFYFRRQNSDQFWKWMRAALEMSYGDRHPAFDLCWRMSPDAAEIFARAIPDRRETFNGYLDYLLGEGRLSATLPVALKLAGAGDPRDRPLLLAASDALVREDSGAAAALWQALGYPAPSGVTRGDFEGPAIGHGFDWRLDDVRGVTHLEMDAPRAHRILLSGRQPEACELLRQIVLLRPGARYVLRWDARTHNLTAPSGVAWSISAERAAIAPADDWRTGEAAFTAPFALTTLTLDYRRPSGEPRAEGWVELRRVAIEEASGANK